MNEFYIHVYRERTLWSILNHSKWMAWGDA